VIIKTTYGFNKASKRISIIFMLLTDAPCHVAEFMTAEKCRRHFVENQFLCSGTETNESFVIANSFKNVRTEVALKKYSSWIFHYVVYVFANVCTGNTNPISLTFAENV